MKKDILVPDIGDFDNVEIIEVLVKEGQKIQKNDSIVTLESDKSSVEVPSTEEGDVLKILVKVGDKVSKGDKLVEIQSASEKKPEPEKKEVKNLDIPKDTEKIIVDAEKSQRVEQEKPVETQTISQEKKKPTRNIEIISDGNDLDPTETKEWLESLSAVLQNDGKERAQYLIKQLKSLSKKNSNIILAGDFNIIPAAEDVYNPKSFEDDALFRLEIRKKLREMINLGFNDVYRKYKNKINKQNYKVVIVDRDKNEVNKLKLKNDKLLKYICDISDPKKNKIMIEDIYKWGKRIDILVNNAGVADFGKIETVKFKNWRKIMDTNLDGTFLTTQNVIKYLKKTTA